MSESWIEAALLDAMPEGSSLEFAHAGRIYALFRVDGIISCVAGLCPHQGGRLAAGTLDGRVVTCPRRGCLRWRFDVRDGSNLAGMATGLRSYPTRVEGGSVLVGVP